MYKFKKKKIGLKLYEELRSQGTHCLYMWVWMGFIDYWIMALFFNDYWFLA